MVSTKLKKQKLKTKINTTNPINKKQVVKGIFPSSSKHKELKILKINKTLTAALLVAIVLSMSSYWGVITKENSIKQLHQNTNKLNYENIELQNKVEYLKSFYTIDNKVSKIDFLKKPDKILEINSTKLLPLKANTRQIQNITSVSGF